MGLTCKGLKVLSIVFGAAKEVGETAARVEKEEFVLRNRNCQSAEASCCSMRLKVMEAVDSIIVCGRLHGVAKGFHSCQKELRR